MKLSKKNIYIIVLCVVVVILATIITLIVVGNKKDKDNKVEGFDSELKDLGIDFYENTYYANIFDKSSLSLMSEGINFSLNSINRSTPISDSLKNKLDEKKCDLDKSVIIFIPKDPYGIKDYELKLELVCE